MGLRDTFKNAADTAITVFGDVAETAWYYQEGSAIYNVSTGNVSSIDSRYMISAIFSKYKSSEIDNSAILPTDLKMTIAQKKFTPVPHQHDYLEKLENYASVRYEVMDYQQDPAGATWVIQLRKP